MIRNISGNNFQPANVQATDKTETQPSATARPQNAEAINTAATVASSVNTWQRASLIQDGSMKQSLLNHELATEQSYAHAQVQANKEKEAREENINGSLFGTIIDGLLIGTFIGDAIGSNTETKQNDLRKHIEATQKEVEKLEEEVAEAQDNSFLETFGDWLTGSDGGVSDIVATKLTPKYDPDDDD